MRISEYQLKWGQCVTGFGETLSGRKQKDGDEVLNFAPRTACQMYPFQEDPGFVRFVTA